MTIEWSLILKNAFPVFILTTIYSYIVCFIIGWRTAANGDKTNIKKEIEKFVLQPFYIATFFSLFSVSFYIYGQHIKQSLVELVFLHVFAVGFTVFFAQFLIEIIESTILGRGTLRILNDKDALRLYRIYILLITLLSLFITLFN